jgi:hypothetical protein
MDFYFLKSRNSEFKIVRYIRRKFVYAGHMVLLRVENCEEDGNIDLMEVSLGNRRGVEFAVDLLHW